MPNKMSDPGPSRRGFLDLLLAVCGAITAAAASIPAFIYLWPITKKGSGIESLADLAQRATEAC